MTTPINQEALANQISNLTGGPKGVTETLPEASIDVEGGVGGSLEIAAIGGKKKKKNTPFVNSLSSAGANTELIEAVEDLQSGNAASVQAFKSNVSDFIDSGASVSQAEVPVFRQTLEDIPLQDFSTFDPLAAGTATNTFDPIEGTFDIGQTTTPADLLAGFAGTDTQISPFDTDTTRGAVGTANLLTNVVRATTVGGQNFADVSKNVATNFFNNSVLLGIPQAIDAGKAFSDTTNFNSVPSIVSGLGAAQIAHGTYENLSKLYTNANSPEQFFTNLKDEIGDRVKGVAEFITDPVSAFKGLGNVFTYGASNPDVTAIDLAHGKISYVLDENGNLVYPGFITALMKMTPFVGNVFSSIQYGARNFTDYYPDLKDRYERLASAAQVGGFKYDDGTATYSNGTDNYINTGTTIDGESFSGKWNTSFNLNTFAQEFPTVTIEDLKNMPGESAYFDIAGHLTDGNLLYTIPEQIQGSGHVISGLSSQAQRLGLSDQTTVAELNQEIGNSHKDAIETYYKTFTDYYVDFTQGGLDDYTTEFTPKMIRDFLRDTGSNFRYFTDQELVGDYGLSAKDVGFFNMMDPTSAEAEQWHDFVVGASEFNYQGFNQEATDIAQTARDLTGRTFTAFGFDPRDKEYTSQLGTLRGMGTTLDKKVIEAVARSVYLGENINISDVNNPVVSIADASEKVDKTIQTLFDEEVPLFPDAYAMDQEIDEGRSVSGEKNLSTLLEGAVNFSKDPTKSVVNTVEKIRNGINKIDNQLKNMRDTVDITTYKNRELFNRARSQLAGNMQTIVDSVTKMNQPTGSEFTLPDRLEPADLFQPATDDRYLPSEVGKIEGSEFTLPDRPADPFMEAMRLGGGALPLDSVDVTRGGLADVPVTKELEVGTLSAQGPRIDLDKPVSPAGTVPVTRGDLASPPAGPPISLAPPPPKPDVRRSTSAGDRLDRDLIGDFGLSAKDLEQAYGLDRGRDQFAGATARTGRADVTLRGSATPAYIGRETSRAIGTAGPIPTVLEFIKDAAADIFGGEINLTPDDSKDPLAPVDIEPYDPETRGGNEPIPVAPPTAPDLEELAAQAGGLVAQSVIDDDAGVSDAAGADAGSFGGEGGGYSGDEGGLW